MSRPHHGLVSHPCEINLTPKCVVGLLQDVSDLEHASPRVSVYNNYTNFSTSYTDVSVSIVSN